MYDYPIPGQINADVPTDDLTREAMSKASNYLLPYKQRFGLAPMTAPVPLGPGTPGAMPAPMVGMPGQDNERLYQAVHPDTFQRVLETIMQLVTGRPIPRIGGGDMEEGKTYKVGENGPETVKMTPGGGGFVIPSAQSWQPGDVGWGPKEPPESRFIGTVPPPPEELIFGQPLTTPIGEARAMIKGLPTGNPVLDREIYGPKAIPFSESYVGQGLRALGNVGQTGLGTAEYLGLGMGYPMVRGKEALESAIGIEPTAPGMTSADIAARMNELLPGGPTLGPLRDVALSALGYRMRPGAGGYPVPGTPGTAGTAGGGAAGPTPAPRGRNQLEALEPAAFANAGWNRYGAPEEGMMYRVGEMGAPVPRAIPTLGPEEQELAARERWGQPGYAAAMATPAGGRLATIPGYERSYYEAHPEEAAGQTMYDMLRPPGRDSYEAGVARMEMQNLMDIASDPYSRKEARVAAAQRIRDLTAARSAQQEEAAKGATGAFMEAQKQAGGGAEDVERLARAEYYRQIPGMEMQKAREGYASGMAETMARIKGQLDVAEIGAGTKNQVMTKLSEYISKRSEDMSRLGGNYNSAMIDQDAGSFMRMLRDGGMITDEQWAKLPPTWKTPPMTEQQIRQHFHSLGKSDAFTEDYIQRARKYGLLS